MMTDERTYRNYCQGCNEWWNFKTKLELPPRIRDEPKAVLNISTTKDGIIKINISKKYENEIEI